MKFYYLILLLSLINISCIESSDDNSNKKQLIKELTHEAQCFDILGTSNQEIIEKMEYEMR